MREFFNRTQGQWAFLTRSDPGVRNTKLAAFVHGFKGKYLGTWGRLPDYLRDHADDGPPFSEWDYLFLGYSTWRVQTYLDIAEVVRTQLRLALDGKAPFTHRYERCALFGHSLGTLGLRQLLCAHTLSGDLLHAVQSVTLFAPPLNGSPWARLVPVAVGEALKPSSPQLRMLREWTKGAYAIRKWPKARVVVGLNDLVVGQPSASFVNWDGDQEVEKFSLGHFNMKEPSSGDDPLVRGFFEEALK